MNIWIVQGGESLEFQNKHEVTNQISPECGQKFQELKIRRKFRYLIFKLGETEVEGE
jgi:hypothetical protein